MWEVPAREPVIRSDRVDRGRPHDLSDNGPTFKSSDLRDFTLPRLRCSGVRERRRWLLTLSVDFQAKGESENASRRLPRDA